MSEALATLVRKSRSSFYYSFLFLPRAKREALYAVYALCRAVDDIADDSGDVEAKAERLKGWREELDRCYAGRPTHFITRALRDCLSRYPIPKGYFDEVIAGVEMDLTVTRYPTIADLARYCYRVASVVGLICIEIFGYRREATKEYAINLGLALQLTNILRDLKTDGRRGRIYLPQEDLERFGYSEDDLLHCRYTPGFFPLMRFEADRARDYFRRAAESLPSEDRKNMAAAEIMGRIYRETLETIARKEFRVFEDRIALPRARKIRLALTTWAQNRFRVQG
ncbi:MAG: squalene/phytoene synthase [candidate division NC10 bacterium CSP1-5]|nr:MAG: squalene/phytoene synthase [candidate division NC10 bacterium CSP1-5]